MHSKLFAERRVGEGARVGADGRRYVFTFEGIRDIPTPTPRHNQIQLLIQNIKLFIFGWAHWQSGRGRGQEAAQVARHFIMPPNHLTHLRVVQILFTFESQPPTAIAVRHTSWSNPFKCRSHSWSRSEGEGKSESESLPVLHACSGRKTAEWVVEHK